MTSYAFSPTFLASGSSFPLPVTGTPGSSLGLSSGQLGSLGSAGCDLISNATLRQLCQLGVNVATGGGTGGEPSVGGSDTGMTGSNNLVNNGGCQPGYTKVGSTCVANNAGAYLPGGQPATLPTSGTQVAGYGPAVIGSFGIPALSPASFSEVRLKCPPGAVLGKDNLCYNKSSIPKKFRKWAPAPKPPVTASDAKAIRRAHSAVSRVERLGKSVGLHVYKNAPKRRTTRK